MVDKLCVSERRTRILEYLCLQKKATRFELALKFNVSADTIERDIKYLSSIAPIYTESGKGGGIRIRDTYQRPKSYLTDIEENFLYNLMRIVRNEERRIVFGIIIKFTKNPIRENERPIITKSNFLQEQFDFYV